jgi:hypothetical protein
MTVAAGSAGWLQFLTLHFGCYPHIRTDFEILHKMRFKLAMADELLVLCGITASIKKSKPLTHAVVGGVLNHNCQKLVYWLKLS